MAQDPKPFPDLEELNVELVRVLERARKSAYLRSPDPGGLVLCVVRSDDSQITGLCLISGTDEYKLDRGYVMDAAYALRTAIGAIYGPEGGSSSWGFSLWEG